MNILGSILGLGVYAAMEELAADKLTETNRAIRTFTDKADILTAGLPDTKKLADEISYYEGYINNLKTTVDRKQKTADILRATLNTQLEAAARAMKLNSRISTLIGNPCAGSGSTLRACSEIKRHCYGFEISKQFYKAAKEEMLSNIQLTL